MPCHHAATIDTPARRRGTEPEPHGCDGTTVPTVPDSRTVAWEVRFSAVLGRAEPIPTSASLPTASTHTSASTQAQWLQVTVRRGLRAPIRDGASLASQGVVASLIGKRLRLNTGSFSVAPGWSSASASLATASTHTYATSALTPIRLTGRRDSDTGALRSAWLATQPLSGGANSRERCRP